MSDIPDGRLDAYLVQVMEVIQEHGWMVQGVFGTEDLPTAFSYTAGLSESNHPELFLDTLNPRQATGILNAVAKLVRADALDPRLGGTFDAEYSCPFAWHGPIDGHHAEVNMAFNLYGDNVTVFQVLWPDTSGKFPFDDDYDFENFPQRLMPLAP